MNLIHRIKEVVMVSVWLAVATSCGWGNMSYSHFSSVPQVWTWKDTVEFELPVLPAGRMYHFEVGVRYTEIYTRRNLRLLLRHNVADSAHWQTDTICCPLYSSEGLSLGKGLFGLYSLDLPYASLPSDGSHQAQVQIIPCMRSDSLRGISDVGITVRSE